MLPADADTLAAMLPHGCSVCGAKNFSFQEVLWPDLINEWQLAPEEVRYVNIQQGFHCTACGNNLRSITLARAICRSHGYLGTLDEWVSLQSEFSIRILEINEAGFLTKHLARLEGHTLVTYPEANICLLPFADGTFDLVLHSDTLEHVANPISALAECRRVLKPKGVLAFTVPIIVDRMTRSRAGLPASHHGASSDRRSDYIVETEFGIDATNFVLAAGFDSVALYSDIYPSSFAFAASK